MDKSLVKSDKRAVGFLRPLRWYREQHPAVRIVIPLGLAMACIAGAWTVLSEGEYAVALVLVGLFLLFGIEAVRETAWSGKSKLIVSLIFAGVAIYSGAIILEKGSGKPWTNLFTRNKQHESPVIQKKPELQGEILQSAFLHAHTGESHIWLQVRVVNTGEPTIVRGWRLRGHSPKFNIDRQPMIIDADYIYDADPAATHEGKIVFHPADGIYEKAVADPLVQGKDLVGWLLYIVRDVNIDALAEAGAEYKITVMDYRNNSYDLTPFTLSGEAHSPEYYPGGGRPQFKIKPRKSQ